eukprot:TRINITY_DN60140_c0_g1_i1.p1 TRINITY_DN60140_c0_g1~~TRINITY_DN60140_c0_g1_i1.p1  ORF type:complete len:105 (-),score=10.76 TRINITY_DN60140_c0_g1_i1:306-620(-)
MSAETKPPPPPVKRPSKSDDDDDVPKEMPKPKPGLLPTGLSRAIVLGSLILGLLILGPLLLSHRYELIAASRSENAMVYRIDTLTGRVSLCLATQCQPVTEKEN